MTRLWVSFIKEKGLFARLPSPQNIDKAKAYLDDLRTSTETLEKIIISCKRRVFALSEFH